MKKLLLSLIIVFGTIATFAQNFAVPNLSLGQVKFYGAFTPTVNLPTVNMCGSANSVAFFQDKLFVGVDCSNAGGIYMYSSNQVLPAPVGVPITISNATGITGLTTDAKGNLYASQIYQNGGTPVRKIIRYDAPCYTKQTILPAPALLTWNGRWFSAFGGLTFDASGNLWATDVAENRLVVYQAASLAANPATAVYKIITGTTQAVGGINYNFFSLPEGIAFDGSGNLWIANNNDSYSTKLNPKGSLVKIPAVNLPALVASGGAITSFATIYPITTPVTNTPSLLGGIVVSGSYLYVNNQNNGATTYVLKYNLTNNTYVNTTMSQTYPGAGGLAIVPTSFTTNAAASLGIYGVTPNATTIPQYEKIELAVNLRANYTNPYDFSQVALQGIFTSPTGVSSAADGFYMQEYNSSLNGGCNGWKVRFTPNAAGTWTYKVRVWQASTNTWSAYSATGTFTCTASTNKGFVKKNTNGYFKFDNGEAFYGVGENMGFDFTPYNYNTMITSWMPKIKNNGGNMVRIWMKDLELFNKLGNYGTGLAANGWQYWGQQQAAQMDALMEGAKTNNIYVQLCLFHHGEINTTINSTWGESPYNSVNGGPCNSVTEWFTNAIAVAKQQNRVRYCIARWGYSPNVLAWEMFNEVDWADNYTNPTQNTAIAIWLNNMATFIKGKDGNKHLVTNSWATAPRAMQTVMTNTNVDFNQFHLYYSGTDIANELATQTKYTKTATNKPFVVGEFGLDAGVSPAVADPTGVHLQQTLWATAAAGAPCAGMVWYWHDYVESKNLYSKFAGIKAFMANTAINTKTYGYASASATTTTKTDLTITPINWNYNDWTTQATAHTITGNGSNIPSQLMCKYLRNPWGGTNKNPVFTVNYPVASTFVIRTGSDVNAGAVISVKIDANAAQNIAVTTNTNYTVVVPAGNHTIILNVVTNDHADVAYYKFVNIVPTLRVIGMKAIDNKEVFGWIQNRNWTYTTTAPAAITAASITFSGLTPNATYAFKLYNTTTGAIASTVNYVASAAGVVTVTGLTVAKDYGFILTDLAIVARTEEVVENSDIQIVNINIFPNPFQNELHIKLAENSTNLHLQLFDLNGNLIKEEDFSNNTNELSWSLSDLPQGLYICRVMAGEDMLGMAKVLKE